MCEIVVEKDPWALEFVPNYLKTQKMCEKTVAKNSMVAGARS